MMPLGVDSGSEHGGKCGKTSSQEERHTQHSVQYARCAPCSAARRAQARFLQCTVQGALAVVPQPSSHARMCIAAANKASVQAELFVLQQGTVPASPSAAGAASQPPQPCAPRGRCPRGRPQAATPPASRAAAVSGQGQGMLKFVSDARMRGAAHGSSDPASPSQAGRTI